MKSTAGGCLPEEDTGGTGSQEEGGQGDEEDQGDGEEAGGGKIGGREGKSRREMAIGGGEATGQEREGREGEGRTGVTGPAGKGVEAEVGRGLSKPRGGTGNGLKTANGWRVQRLGA